MKHNVDMVVRLGFIVLIPLIAAFGTYKLLATQFLEPADATNTQQVLVEVSPGMTFRDVCRLLQEKGILRHGRSLDILARLKGANTRAINAGEYTLSPSMRPAEILATLASGKVFQRVVAVKEGVSIREIGKLVEEAGLLPKSEFDKALIDPNLLVQAGIASSSFEGYLFPDTYNFSRPTTPRQIIWRMLEEGEKHWTPQFSEQAAKLRLTRHEVLTLASIIEKESGNPGEQPLISSVFHNRLSQGMRLDSDPTVIYGIPNFDGNLKREHLEDPNNQYNTYIHYGLPQGPVANPGESAIRAALYPADSTFVYFVADGSGGHVFSNTLKEHNEAVARYQKGQAPSEHTE